MQENLPDDLYRIDDCQKVSGFRPENLADSAIRQKKLERENVPSICILDPDGDIVRYPVKTGRARKFSMFETNEFWYKPLIKTVEHAETAVHEGQFRDSRVIFINVEKEGGSQE